MGRPLNFYETIRVRLFSGINTAAVGLNVFFCVFYPDEILTEDELVKIQIIIVVSQFSR